MCSEDKCYTVEMICEQTSCCINATRYQFNLRSKCSTNKGIPSSFLLAGLLDINVIKHKKQGDKFSA